MSMSISRGPFRSRGCRPSRRSTSFTTASSSSGDSSVSTRTTAFKNAGCSAKYIGSVSYRDDASTNRTPAFANASTAARSRPRRSPRLLPSPRRASATDDGVGDFGHPSYLANIVDAHDVRSAGDGQRHRRRRPFHAVVLGRAEQLAEETLARWADEQRVAERGQLWQPAQQLQVVFARLAKTKPWVQHKLLLS